VYKLLGEHNSYPFAPSMRTSVVLSSLVIPAQAGIHCGSCYAPPAVSNQLGEFGAETSKVGYDVYAVR
jgi:hypothetical protein